MLRGMGTHNETSSEQLMICEDYYPVRRSSFGLMSLFGDIVSQTLKSYRLNGIIIGNIFQITLVKHSCANVARSVSMSFSAVFFSFSFFFC